MTMPTELLRDKQRNVENQLNQAKLSLYLCEIQVSFAEDAPTNADEVTKAAFQNLKSEADGARVNAIVLRRKVAVLQPIFDALTKEIEAEGAS